MERIECNCILLEQLTRQGKNLWKTKLRPRLSWLLPKENRVNGSFLRKEKWKKNDSLNISIEISLFLSNLDVFVNTNSSITLMLNEQSKMEICNRLRLGTEKRGNDFYGITQYKRKMNCSRNANSLLLSITRSSVSF